MDEKKGIIDCQPQRRYPPSRHEEIPPRDPKDERWGQRVVERAEDLKRYVLDLEQQLHGAKRDALFWRQEYHNRTEALRGQQKGILRLHRKADRFRKEAEMHKRNFELLAEEYQRLASHSFKHEDTPNEIIESPASGAAHLRE